MNLLLVSLIPIIAAWAVMKISSSQTKDAGTNNYLSSSSFKQTLGLPKGDKKNNNNEKIKYLDKKYVGEEKNENLTKEQGNKLSENSMMEEFMVSNIRMAKSIEKGIKEGNVALSVNENSDLGGGKVRTLIRPKKMLSTSFSQPGNEGLKKQYAKKIVNNPHNSTINQKSTSIENKVSPGGNVNISSEKGLTNKVYGNVKRITSPKLGIGTQRFSAQKKTKAEKIDIKNYNGKEIKLKRNKGKYTTSSFQQRADMARLLSVFSDKENQGLSYRQKQLLYYFISMSEMNGLSGNGRERNFDRAVFREYVRNGNFNLGANDVMALPGKVRSIQDSKRKQQRANIENEVDARFNIANEDAKAVERIIGNDKTINAKIRSNFAENINSLTKEESKQIEQRARINLVRKHFSREELTDDINKEKEIISKQMKEIKLNNLKEMIKKDIIKNPRKADAILGTRGGQMLRQHLSTSKDPQDAMNFMNNLIRQYPDISQNLDNYIENNLQGKIDNVSDEEMKRIEQQAIENVEERKAVSLEVKEEELQQEKNRVIDQLKEEKVNEIKDYIIRKILENPDEIPKWLGEKTIGEIQKELRNNSERRASIYDQILKRNEGNNALRYANSGYLNSMGYGGGNNYELAENVMDAVNSFGNNSEHPNVVIMPERPIRMVMQNAV